jgi:hypothetical protein
MVKELEDKHKRIVFVAKAIANKVSDPETALIAYETLEREISEAKDMAQFILEVMEQDKLKQNAKAEPEPDPEPEDDFFPF